MDKENLIKYAPILVVIFATCFQFNLFVTPEKLEKTHREITVEIADRYTTKEQHNDLAGQIKDMQQKLDKIYDILSKK